MVNEELILSLSYTLLMAGVLFCMFLFTHFRPPKYSNPVYGYRTGLSLKNEKYWRFSNDLSQKYFGWIIFIFTLISVGKTLLLTDYFSLISDITLTSVLLPLMFVPMIIRIEYLLHKMDKEEKTKST